MANSYLTFITDEKLFRYVGRLFRIYENSKAQMNLNQFYKNKVDPIKFLFDVKFNGISDSDLIMSEINRKIDKTINNAIGTFHEQLIGGLDGFANIPVGGGYDIKNDTNTIFAEVKNKHNTMNSSATAETFRKLTTFADQYPNSIAYLVQVIAVRSVNTLWQPSGEYHPRVRLISIDKFYELATGIPDAFRQQCTALPNIIQGYLTQHAITPRPENNLVFEELQRKAVRNRRDIISQIMIDNFDTYIGF